MKWLLPCNGERRLEKWKLLESLEAPKALGGFLHGRACPTQSSDRSIRASQPSPWCRGLFSHSVPLARLLPLLT